MKDAALPLCWAWPFPKASERGLSFPRSQHTGLGGTVTPLETGKEWREIPFEQEAETSDHLEREPFLKS